jgi:hypothetical protein
MAMTQERLEYQRAYRARTGYAASKKYMAKIDTDFDKFVNHNFRSIKAGAKKRDLSFNLSKKQVYNKLKNSKYCAKTGVLLEHKRNSPNKASIDRINSGHGYSLKNIQIVSQQYNYSKMDTPDQEFAEFCCTVADFYRSKMSR